MDHRMVWEMVTVLLLVLTLALLFVGTLTDETDPLRTAAPTAGMAIATATLALVRKP